MDKPRFVPGGGSDYSSIAQSVSLDYRVYRFN